MSSNTATPRDSVLSPRDRNAQMKPQSPEKKEKKPESNRLEAARQELATSLQDGDRKKQYISPSDSIQSPTQTKLEAMRNKQVKKAKGRTLFDTASSNRIESAKDTPASFADVPKKDDTPNRKDGTLTSVMTADKDSVYHRNLSKSPAFGHAKPVEEARKEMGVSEDPEKGNDPDGDEEKQS